MNPYKNLYDTHMHSSFSGDSDTAPLDQINASKMKGLSGIIFTDHMDLGFPEDPDLFLLDIENYLPTMRKAAKENETPDFHIGVGMELGLNLKYLKEHESYIKNNSFDYIIGSIHLVNGQDPYYDSYFEGRDVKDTYLEYFETMLENIKVFPDFDSLGHMDYIVRYAKRFYGDREGALSYSDFKNLFDEILTFIIEKNISFEINTGAFRTGLNEPNPSWEFIQRYYDLGGRMITLGADAHKTEHVGLEFESVAPKLKKIGFEGTLLYVDRNPIMKKL